MNDTRTTQVITKITFNRYDVPIELSLGSNDIIDIIITQQDNVNSIELRGSKSGLKSLAKILLAVSETSGFHYHLDEVAAKNGLGDIDSFIIENIE